MFEEQQEARMVEQLVRGGVEQGEWTVKDGEK